MNQISPQPALSRMTLNMKSLHDTGMLLWGPSISQSKYVEQLFKEITQSNASSTSEVIHLFFPWQPDIELKIYLEIIRELHNSAKYRT